MSAVVVLVVNHCKTIPNLRQNIVLAKKNHLVSFRCLVGQLSEIDICSQN